MDVTERNFNFRIEDCFALNRTLKYCCSPQEKERTLRVKNCLYFDIELFLELMTKLCRRYTFNSFYFILLMYPNQEYSVTYNRCEETCTEQRKKH